MVSSSLLTFFCFHSCTKNKPYVSLSFRIFDFIFEFHKLLFLSHHGVMHNLFSKYDNWCLVNFQDFLIFPHTPRGRQEEGSERRDVSVCRRLRVRINFNVFARSMFKMQLSLGLCMQLSNLFGCVFLANCFESSNLLRKLLKLIFHVMNSHKVDCLLPWCFKVKAQKQDLLCLKNMT